MTEPEQQPPISDEEMRAAYEEQLRRITPTDLIAQTVISLINLAGRRLGLVAGEEGERDLVQVRDAIDGVRALMPLLERVEQSEALGPLRDALSALQVEFAKLAREQGAPPPPPAPAAGEPAPPGAGPAQSSGRLWIPGQ